MTSTQQQQIDQLLAALLKLPAGERSVAHHKISVRNVLAALAGNQSELVEQQEQRERRWPPDLSHEELALAFPSFKTSAGEIIKLHEAWQRRVTWLKYFGLGLAILAGLLMLVAVVALLKNAVSLGLSAVLASLVVQAICLLFVQQQAQARQRVSEFERALETAATLFKLIQIVNDLDEDWFSQRRAALIDKKFSGVLSSEEKAELERLNARLEEFDARFYEPILNRLQAFHAQLLARASHSQPEKG